MASPAIQHEVDELREYMKELSYQAMRTDMSVNGLSEEMREFKDETRRDRQRMNKQSLSAMESEAKADSPG